MDNFRHIELDKEIDLVGIGNAIVDLIVNVEDVFLETNNLQKGSMSLIGISQSDLLLQNCEVIKKISGGSSANTVVSLANLGNKVQFMGRIKDDYFGNIFSNDIKESGTIFNMNPINSEESSAHSIIFITPDAQRTMCTYLGASIEFDKEDINESSIRKSKYLYLEGYLWDSKLAKKAFIQAAKIAKESETKIILSLSDSFCVERHRESFLNLIKEYVDILFCNEGELKSLLKEQNIHKCKNKISSICPLIIITLGNKGSIIYSEDKKIEIEPYAFGEVIDTTGAGDIYAGGFINGLINNYPLKKCGILGSICAGHIITQIGSRTNQNLTKLINKNLSN